MCSLTNTISVWTQLRSYIGLHTNISGYLITNPSIAPSTASAWNFEYFAVQD